MWGPDIKIHLGRTVACSLQPPVHDIPLGIHMIFHILFFRKTRAAEAQWIMPKYDPARVSKHHAVVT